MRPVIALSGRHTRARGPRVEPIEWQYRDYIEAIRRAGAVPLIIPSGLDSEEIEALLARSDGVLLCGGDDIEPGHYSEPARPDANLVSDAFADTTDLAIARRALDTDLPILGLCRGQQMMAVVSGAPLWQDLPSQNPTAITHTEVDGASSHHPVLVQPGSRLAEIIGVGPLTVNSRHHQAVRDVGTGFVIVAEAPDGVCEAIEFPAHRFAVGVQWHPEEMTGEPSATALFDALVSATSGH
jgi:putative glutamine amidotransferase